MKKLLVAVSLILVAIMSVALVGCSASSNIEGELKDAGYVKIELNDIDAEYQKNATINALDIYGGRDSQKNKIFAKEQNSKKVPYAIVIELGSKENLTEYLSNKALTLKGYLQSCGISNGLDMSVEKLTEIGFVKGDCVVIALRDHQNLHNIVKQA